MEEKRFYNYDSFSEEEAIARIDQFEDQLEKGEIDIWDTRMNSKFLIRRIK